MKGKRFAVEQIVAILKQAEPGMSVADIVRKWDIGADLLPVEEAVWRYAV